MKWVSSIMERGLRQVGLGTEAPVLSMPPSQDGGESP